MPFFRGTRYPMLGPTPNKYLLDDEFHGTLAAGAVHNSLATPGPGLRTVVDTDGDALSIGSGVLQFANANGAGGDPSYWLDAVSRAAGQVILLEITPSATNATMHLGIDTNQAGTPGEVEVRFKSGAIQLVEGGAGAAVISGAYTTTSHLLALILRLSGYYVFMKEATAFPNWTLLWVSDNPNTATLYPTISTFSQDPALAFLRVPAATWLPTPLCYDSFPTDGALTTSASTGPDGQPCQARTWSGATWTVSGGKAVNTPTETTVIGGATLNGNFAAWTADNPDSWSVTGEVANDPEISEAATGEAHADTPTLGGGMCNLYTSDGTVVSIWQQVLTVGGWYKTTINIDTVTAGGVRVIGNITAITGTTTGTKTAVFRASVINFSVIRHAIEATDVTFDDVTLASLPLAELLNVPDLGVANVVAEIEIAVNPAGTQAGLAIGWDSAASPANGILVYTDGTNVKIDKNVAGTWTSVQSTATAFSANAKLVCVRDGSSVSVFYNNALVGATQTISDAAILAGTRHGMFSTNATPTMDNVLIFPRTGGNYSDLNRWSGVNP